VRVPIARARRCARSPIFSFPPGNHASLTPVPSRSKSNAPRRRRPRRRARDSADPPFPARVSRRRAEAGQALASRPDLLPGEYLEELQKLQDDVPTFGNDIAFRIVEEELKQKFVDVFELIEPEPVAGACRFRWNDCVHYFLPHPAFFLAPSHPIPTAANFNSRVDRSRYAPFRSTIHPMTGTKDQS
jgi:hypothetical protein